MSHSYTFIFDRDTVTIINLTNHRVTRRKFLYMSHFVNIHLKGQDGKTEELAFNWAEDLSEVKELRIVTKEPFDDEL